MVSAIFYFLRLLHISKRNSKKKKEPAKDIKMQNVTFANTCRPNESAERNFFRWKITKGGKRERGTWNDKYEENWKEGNDEKNGREDK